MMNSIDNFDYVAYRDGTIDGEMLYIIQYMVAANNADKMLGGLVAGGGGVATGTIVTPEGYLVEVELSGGYAGVAENIGSMVAEGALSGVLAMNGQGGPNKGDSETGNWNKGSFDSPEDSLDYHYGRHGDEVGATSRDQYLRKAEEFAKTAKKGSTKSRVDGAVEGTIRYKKNGKYIDIAPDGSIVSFGKQ